MKTTLSIALLTLGATGLQAGQDPRANPVEQYLASSPVAELRAEAVRLESAIQVLEQEAELQQLDERAELMLASQAELGAMRLEALDLEFERDRIHDELEMIGELYGERFDALEYENDERREVNEERAERERDLAESRLELELMQMNLADPEKHHFEIELREGELRFAMGEKQRSMDVDVRVQASVIRAEMIVEREKLRSENRHEERGMREQLQVLERESLRAEMAIETHTNTLDTRLEQAHIRAELVARRERGELEARLSAVEAVLESQEEIQSHATDLADVLSMLEAEILALRADVERLSKLIGEGL